MCGITGVLRFDGQAVENKTFVQFNDSLSHRGPDFGSTFFEDEPTLALGHRRLSIIDLDERAHQPMHSASGRYVLTFNGEIYNYLEVRKELETKGCHFQTQSDTEVLLQAYEYWGKQCLDKFNGMWAFAIWDRQKKCLFLARDRFGVKPLYFVYQPHFFAFASEQKSFADLKGFDFALAPEQCAFAVCNNGLIESVRPTLYQHVQKLHAGEAVEVCLSGKLQFTRWWNTSEHMEQEVQVSHEELVESFVAATGIRTRADVPLATSLSGGLDSSAVTSCLAHFYPEADITAFIGAFPGSPLDESAYAQSLVQQYQTKSVQIDINQVLTPDLVEKAVLANDEILPQPPIGPYCIYQSQRAAGYKLSLEGHGGDELLGGYSTHARAMVGELIANKAEPVLIANAIIACSDLMQAFEGYNASRLQSSILNSTTADTSLKKEHYLLKMLNVHNFDKPESTYNDMHNLSHASRLAQKLYWDFHYGCLQSNLRDFDRLSMANGIEVRSPFMDWRFVVKCFNASHEFKLWDGKSKRLIRDYFHFVPKNIRARTSKLGFNNPFELWLKGTLKTWLTDFISSQHFRESRLFDGQLISEKILKAYGNESAKDIIPLWPLINIAMLEQR